MTPSSFATVFLSTFVSTVFLLQWWQQSSYPLWLTGCLAVAGCIGLRKTRFLLPASVGVIIALVSVSHAVGTSTEHQFDVWADQENVTVTGTIAAVPSRQGKVVTYGVRVHTIGSDDQLSPIKGYLQVRDTKGWPDYRYGESITASGTLQTIASLDDTGYQNYLRSQKIDALLSTTSIRRTDHSSKASILGTLFQGRSTMERLIQRLYPEPHASLLIGLLDGNRNGIPKNLSNSYKATGLTHLLAISGFNITLVLSLLGTALFWLPLKWRFVPSVVGVILFTLLTGASASVVRACIMGILGLMALQLGRLSSIRLSILWTLFFMLVWNPLQLWYDAGFQLSFLALIGVVEAGPLLKFLCHWCPDTCGIRDTLEMTLSAQLLASPWIVFLFGQLSLIAPIANILVAPAVPFAMFFGALSLLIASIFPLLSPIVTSIGWLPLEWMIRVPTLLAHLPFAFLTVGSLSSMLIGVYYLALMPFLVWAAKKEADDTEESDATEE